MKYLTLVLSLAAGAYCAAPTISATAYRTVLQSSDTLYSIKISGGMNNPVWGILIGVDQLNKDENLILPGGVYPKAKNGWKFDIQPIEESEFTAISIAATNKQGLPQNSILETFEFIVPSGAKTNLGSCFVTFRDSKRLKTSMSIKLSPTIVGAPLPEDPIDNDTLVVPPATDSGPTTPVDTNSTPPGSDGGAQADWSPTALLMQDAGVWSSTCASPVLNSDLNGKFLSFPAQGYCEYGSVNLDITPGHQVGKIMWKSRLSRVQQNPYWLGDVQIYIESKKAGIWKAWVGRYSFENQALGAWAANSIEIPSDLRLKLESARTDDLKIILAINVAAGGGEIDLKEMIFVK